MQNRPETRTLLDAYRVRGFRARTRVEGSDHNPPAFVITLIRRQKKRGAAGVENPLAAFMTGAGIAPAISIAALTKCISTLNFTAWTAKSVVG
jgi:hypothetical protein